MPAQADGNEAASRQSPLTISVAGPIRGARNSGRRAKQRTGWPAACSAFKSRPPTYPVAPVNKISGFVELEVMAARRLHVCAAVQRCDPRQLDLGRAQVIHDQAAEALHVGSRSAGIGTAQPQFNV